MICWHSGWMVVQSGTTPLFACVESNLPSIAEVLLEHGADPNSTRVCRISSQQNMAAWCEAVYHLSACTAPTLQVVKSHISTGTVEETPLADACARGKQKMAEMLVTYGAKVNWLCSVSKLFVMKHAFRLLMPLGCHSSSGVCHCPQPVSHGGVHDSLR